MHEFDRNVLRVGCLRAVSEGEEPTASKEPVSHFATCVRKTPGLACKKGLKKRVACEESASDLLRNGGTHGRHEFFSTDAGQRVAYEHVHHSTAAVSRCDQDRACRLGVNLPDETCLFAAAGPSYGIQNGIRCGRVHDCQELPFIRNVKGVETKQFAGATHGISDRQRFFLKNYAETAIMSEFVERSGDSAPGGIAHPSYRRSCRFGGGFHERQDRARI